MSHLLLDTHCIDVIDDIVAYHVLVLMHMFHLPGVGRLVIHLDVLCDIAVLCGNIL